jgi:DNA-binding NtrC family response regulator
LKFLIFFSLGGNKKSSRSVGWGVTQSETTENCLFSGKVSLLDRYGLELLKEMKRDEKGKKIPVGIISGVEGADLVNAKLQGAYETLSKPYNYEELLASVKRALSKELRNPDLFDGRTGQSR